MLKFYALFIILCISINSQAQWYKDFKPNKKSKALYDLAERQAQQNLYNNSINYLTQALSIDSNYLDALLARASMYEAKKDYRNAIADFEKCYAKDSVFCIEYLLNFANTLAAKGDFNKALNTTNNYLRQPTISEKNKLKALQKKVQYEFAVANVLTNFDFKLKNLGSNINSTELEYLPSLTIDGKSLIFNRRIKGDEDFYESKLVNNQWQPAVLLPGKINTQFNEGAHCISQDGEWLVFTGCNYPEGLGSCDLFISYKQPNGEWSEAENMGKPINSDAWESYPALSPDKKELYFASNRRDGIGGTDIWVSRFENGAWQKPLNLNTTINTKGDEDSPFMHADGTTFYFSSDGHKGFGSKDLFVTKRELFNLWTKPQNLGYPINTQDEETAMIVASNGNTAYYTSDKGTAENKLDLYSFELPAQFAATKTLWVKGNVFNKKNNAKIPCSITVTDNSNKKILQSIQVDTSGQYLATLPVGLNMSFTVLKNGFLFYSENFNLPQVGLDTAFNIDIYLQPIEKDASIVLKNIFFETNKATLQSTSFAELDYIAELLKNNAKLIIQINGHTDNVGKPADNLLLSNKRSKAVTAYLQSKGISSRQLISKGFGALKPITDNNTEQGRSKNRRTEMIVISK
jgi:outer membrane protein OmpA-like peptidoglycan-associated protein/tetratricopeptide (TPR) repeat protein